MSTTVTPRQQIDVEKEVRERYAGAAAAPEAALCCPTLKLEPRYLEALPDEIIAKDYGCGDPSRYVRPGETVVDLGSGAGKACYIMAQIVGETGRVIGVDFNPPMLSLARKYQDEIAGKLGYANTRFVKARIQDLALDLDKVDAWLNAHPVRTAEDLVALESECARLRREEPLIPDNSVDVVVSNCVLNLVQQDQKAQLFSEIFRVLRNGGRAVISDICCDEPPTERILNDPELWSGCISGAFLEQRFPQMFAEAGFYGVELLDRHDEPWQVIDGIEFRSVTIRAFKGKQGPCLERNQAVMYKGPWKAVTDDDGHMLRRGERMAVCDKTFRIMTNPAGPYAGQIVAVPPREEIPLDEAKPFDCRRRDARDPRETKGLEYRETVPASGDVCCGPDCC